MPLSNGQVLNNRYRIISQLGQGGFGAVYKAWDTKLNGPCALKENFEPSPEAEKQFAREASMLFNLRHPNLPMVFDYFTLQGQGQYLVMVFVEGQDLQQILDQRQGSLSETEVLPWMQQVCDALHYLHSQEPPIIHRDIKPANIKITPQGQVVLVDFGIAKVYDPKLKTTVGARAVTPGYSPPEQYGRGRTDTRSDIYALGATMYALLSGEQPADSVDLLASGKGAAAGLSNLNSMVSSTVSDAVQRAMQLDRDRRYQSVAAFKTALMAVPETVRAVSHPQPSDILATKKMAQPPQLARVRPSGKRGIKAWLVLMLAIVVLMAVAALALAIEPSREWLFEVFEDPFSDFEVVIRPSEEEPFPAGEAEPDQFPEPRRFDVTVEDDPHFGPRNAPVTLIEFGDFGCGECRFWHLEIWPRLQEAFGEELQFFFLNFPLEHNHPESFSAALAANCAMEQDRYWEYHDLLITWEHELGGHSYFIYAEDLGFDMDGFRFCLDAERYRDEIHRDIEMADKLGVEVTPTFFINGIRLDGPQPFEVFAQLIERELERR